MYIERELSLLCGLENANVDEAAYERTEAENLLTQRAFHVVTRIREHSLLARF